MLSGTARRSLLLLLLTLMLLGVLAVALAMNAFPHLALLALGAVFLIVILLDTHKTLVVLVPAVSLYFHSSGLKTLASVVFVSCMALQLSARGSPRFSVTPLYRLTACSIVGLNRSLVTSLSVYDVEQCFGFMHYEIEPHLPFHLAA